MSLVDHEACWLDLEELIQSRDGWGSATLAAEMAKIRAGRRVSETQVEQVLRLYGGRIQIIMSTPEAPASGPGGTTPTEGRAGPGPIEDPGGRDGSSTRQAVPA